MNKLLTRTGLFTVLTLSCAAAMAAGDHVHSHDNDSRAATMSHDDHAAGASHGDHGAMNNDKMFLVEKEVGEYNVSFHVMAAKKGMEHGGSHNVMIKIEEGGKALANVKINSKVVHPNGNAETKPLMKMGEWYMNGYDLGHGGKHQLMILFKTEDGKKHKAGVYFPGGG